jgi:predicted HNH restriction endonuclease
MTLVAMQHEVIDLLEYRSPNCHRLLHRAKHIEKAKLLSLLFTRGRDILP